MRLIYTNDGMIGLDFDSKCYVIWCNTRQEAAQIMKSHYRDMTLQEVWNEMSYAIDEMVKHKHDVAEFGIFGSFIFSKDSEEDAA